MIMLDNDINRLKQCFAAREGERPREPRQAKSMA